MWFKRKDDANGGVEAEAALKDAQRNLRRVQNRSREVSRISKALKDIRERNHFAEELEDIILRPRGQH